jgi:hypothetical protein
MSEIKRQTITDVSAQEINMMLGDKGEVTGQAVQKRHWEKTGNITLASASYTLPEADYQKQVLTVSVAHATNALLLPAIAGMQYLIENLSYTLSVIAKVSGQTGVKVAPRSHTWVRCNGTDYELAVDNSMYAAHIAKLGTPAAADDDFIVASANMKNGSYTIANATLAVARNVTVTATAVETADTMGTVTVTGSNIAGATISEVVTPVAGSAVAGKKAFKTITSVVGAGWEAVGGNDTIKVGMGTVLGMPVALGSAAQMVLGFLGTSCTAHTPVVATGTPTIEETTVDMSAGTYDGSKAAVVMWAY